MISLIGAGEMAQNQRQFEAVEQGGLGLDRLSERITVSARKAGRDIADARPVFVSDAPGGQTVGLTASQVAVKATKLDLMLVVDTTGSMGDEIRYLQSELRSIIAAITEKHRDLDIRIGFVFYRDMGDDYVTRTVAFDRDIGRVQGALARQDANGGGDYPEAIGREEEWISERLEKLYHPGHRHEQTLADGRCIATTTRSWATQWGSFAVLQLDQVDGLWTTGALVATPDLFDAPRVGPEHEC